MIPTSAPFIDTALLVFTAWLMTYLIHSTILLGAVWLLGRYLRPALALEDTLWKMALVGAMATALWQVAGVGGTPFGHRLGLSHELRVAEAPPGDELWVWSDDAPLADVTFVTADAFLADDAFVTDDVTFAADASFTSATTLEAEPLIEMEPLLEVESPYGLIEEPDLEESEGGKPGAAFTAIPATLSWKAETPATRGPGIGAAGAVSGARAIFIDTGDRLQDFVSRVPWSLLLLAAWALGAGVGLVRLGWARVRLHRILRGRREITEGHLIGMLDRLRAAGGVTRPVKLSMSLEVAGPVALGSGEICLPRRVLTDLNPGQQQSVLAHELAHLERGDPRWLWMTAAVEALFFFQPLNRLARRRLRDTAEFLCDDWAVRHAGGNLILARCLAEVAGWVQAPPALASGMAQRSSPLVRRIERLLEDRDLFREPGRGWRLAAGLVLVAVVAFTAPGITTGSYERADNAPWLAGQVPWPDYPFMLTPPGWTTTPLSTTTGMPLETEGDLGELYGPSWTTPITPPSFSTRIPPRIPPRRLSGAVRSQPPSPSEAIRLRPQGDHAQLIHEAQARAEIERARRRESVHRNHELRETVLHQARQRAVAEQRATEPPRTIILPRAPRSTSIFSGEAEIPSEGFATVMEQLAEHLDGPLEIDLGELSGAFDFTTEDGVVELQLDLDHLNLDQIKENVVAVQERLQDPEQREALQRVLQEKGREFERVFRVSADTGRREVWRELRASELGDTFIFFDDSPDSTDNP